LNASTAATYAYDKPLAACPSAGKHLKARYDLDMLRRTNWFQQGCQARAGLWRYHELLPIYDTRNIVSLGEGWTPSYMQKPGHDARPQESVHQGERQGPTAFSKIVRRPWRSRLCANRASPKRLSPQQATSLSLFRLRSPRRIKIWSFLTSLVPGEKMREAAIYGGEVIKVTGTYDQAKVVAPALPKVKGCSWIAGSEYRCHRKYEDDGLLRLSSSLTGARQIGLSRA